MICQRRFRPANVLKSYDGKDKEMANVDNYIVWTDCQLVEQVPGKVSGRPIVRGTRILAAGLPPSLSASIS